MVGPGSRFFLIPVQNTACFEESQGKLVEKYKFKKQRLSPNTDKEFRWLHLPVIYGNTCTSTIQNGIMKGDQYLSLIHI